MQTHQTGNILGTRLAPVLVRHGFQLTFDLNLTGVDLLLATIPASVVVPAGYRLRAVIVTADDSGTSSVLRIGTAAGGTTLLNDVDLKAAAGTNYTTTNDTLVVTADTQIWARITRVGTAATAGKVIVFLEPFDVNVTQPTNQGS